MEREEPWIAKIRQTLQRSAEPLPEGGWEALSRDLAAAERRGGVFLPVWKRIAAAAAVVAAAVWIGETVLIRNTAELSAPAAPLAGQIETAAEEIPAEELRTQAADASLLASAADAVRPVGGGRSLAADRSAQPQAGGHRPSAQAAHDVSTVKASAPAAETGREQESAPAEHAAASAAERQMNDAAMPKAAAASGRSRTTAQPEQTSIAGAATGRTAARTFEPAKPARRRSFGLFAAGLPTAQHVSSGRATPMRVTHVVNSSGIVRMKRGYNDYLYRHKQPLSFGLSVRKEFAHGLSLESGLVYSLLRSDVRVSLDDESFTESLHMLGIPLKVNWTFLARSNWRLYVAAGGMVEKALYAQFGSESVSEKALQWSLGANAGVQYDFTRRTALYFEPGISCYLTETDLRTARTASPVNLSLQLGVRLTY